MKSEREILNSVYGERDNLAVLKQEKPDFRLCYKENDGCFGVEVTEYYYSETDARTRNIPEYPMEILDNEKYRHKDDKKNLPVKEVKIISSEDGSEQKVKAIMQDTPNYQEYLDEIRNLIVQKNDKFGEYRKDLRHINLIIYNTELFLFLGKAPEDFYTIFYTQGITRSLLNSNYREIYFITKMEAKNGDKTEVYIPLKMLLFLSRIYLFGGLLRKECKEVMANEHKLANQLAQLFIHEGFKNIRIREWKNYPELLYGNMGIVLDPKENLKIHDYNDFPLPKDSETQSKEDNSVLGSDSEIQNKIQEVIENYTFLSPLAFEVYTV